MKTKELKKLDRSGGIQGSNESKNIIKLIPHIEKIIGDRDYELMISERPLPKDTNRKELADNDLIKVINITKRSGQPCIIVEKLKEPDIEYDIDIEDILGPNPTSQISRYDQIKDEIEKEKPIKIAITIPAYNEEDCIGKVISEIPRKIEGIDEIEIIVINDGSKDRTVEVAKEAGANTIVHFSKNKGLAMAFKEGLNAAIDSGADIIVNIDADGQYNATEIQKLIKPILDGKAEMVLGSRFAGTIEHMVPQKRWGNRLATFVVGWVAGMNVSDAQTGFRAFSREAAMRLFIHTGYTYTQEMIIQAVHKRLSIVEVPVEFRKRKNGGSRLISNVLKYAKHSAATLIRTYTYYNPLGTFSMIGGSLFLVGVLFGLRVLIHFITTGMVTPYLPTAVLSSGLAIIGFQIIVIGLIADMSHQNRHIMEEVLYRMKKASKPEEFNKRNQIITKEVLPLRT